MSFTKPCGCPWGACTCDSAPVNYASVIINSAKNLDDYINRLKERNSQLKKENQLNFRKQLKIKDGILKPYKKEAAKIISEAKEIKKKARLVEKLALSIKPSLTTMQAKKNINEYLNRFFDLWGECDMEEFKKIMYQIIEGDKDI